MPRTLIVPHAPSSGARALAAELGVRLVRTRDSRYRPRHDDTLINWGRSELPFLTPGGIRILNDPYCVGVAQDKLRAFLRFREADVAHVEFTTERHVAHSWYQGGSVVMCRTLTRASEGRGLIVVHPEDPYREGLPNAPLYTRYFKGTEEYRIHVVNHQVIDVQRKRRRSGFEGEPNRFVRNLENGWVFCRENVTAPACCHAEAVAACAAVGLTFGAVDIKYNPSTQQCAVLEINTAPGLEGTTVSRYAAALRPLIDNQ